MSMEDLRELKRRHSFDLLHKPGVSGVGIETDDEGRPALTIHLSTDDPEVKAQLPTDLDGYPVRYIQSGPYKKLDA